VFGIGIAETRILSLRPMRQPIPFVEIELWTMEEMEERKWKRWKNEEWRMEANQPCGHKHEIMHNALVQVAKGNVSDC
jgi:hypothetical protein